MAPNISAYAYQHGSFDYKRMPIAPIGCAVQFHIKPGRRKTFGEHSADGFYLKTSEEHYRTHIVFLQEDTSKMTGRHGVFQAQVYNASHGHAGGHHCQRTYKTAGCHPGNSTLKDDTHFEALRCLENTLKPPDKKIIKTGKQVKVPRVDKQLNLPSQGCALTNPHQWSTTPHHD